MKTRSDIAVDSGGGRCGCIRLAGSLAQLVGADPGAIAAPANPRDHSPMWAKPFSFPRSPSPSRSPPSPPREPTPAGTETKHEKINPNDVYTLHDFHESGERGCDGGR